MTSKQDFPFKYNRLWRVFWLLVLLSKENLYIQEVSDKYMTGQKIELIMLAVTLNDGPLNSSDHQILPRPCFIMHLTSRGAVAVPYE